jgi:hypothetical protein
MKMTICNAGALVMALGLAATVLPASARNTESLRSIQATLATPEARAAIGDDITFSFGAALPTGFVVMEDNVKVRGKADPRVTTGRPGVSDLTDDEACKIAFINAVADLAKQARKRGRKAVLGIVNFYEEKVRDDKDRYECHSGMTRSIVELRGVLAAPGQAGMATLMAKGGVSAQHRSAMPPDTKFAEIDNIGAVPLNDAGRERYRHYLTLQPPKAFVVFEGGTQWRFYHDDPDAMTKALDYCQQINKACWLYAVDHRVVWSDNPSKRIGRSSQLGNE